MWEQINKFYLFLSEPNSREQVLTSPNEFYKTIKMNSHLFFGISSSIMLHNESWHFYRLGQLFERADKTSRIIDVKYFHILPDVNCIGTTFDDIQWSYLLKSASGFEMYRKTYQRISPDKIIEFLILNTEFPRSIAYCLNYANLSLHQISGSNIDSYQNKAEQILGALRSELAYADINSIISLGLHDFVDNLQKKLNHIGECVHMAFFDINDEPVYCLKELNE